MAAGRGAPVYSAPGVQLACNVIVVKGEALAAFGITLCGGFFLVRILVWVWARGSLGRE